MAASKPNYSRKVSTVDSFTERTRVAVVVEQEIGAFDVGLDGFGNPTTAAFEIIASYADKHVRVDNPLRFAFPTMDTTMRVVVSIDEPA